MEIDITKWNRISEDAFNAFGYDSGLLVKNFDPTDFSDPDDDDILCTTTGNITASMTPTVVDLGEDVNGIHGQFAELQVLQNWACQLGFTALEMSPEMLKMELGAADIQGNGVKPRTYIKQSDFIQNIALILFKIGGGLTAVVLNLGMSTGGVSITTSKAGKVNSAVTLTGYQSMNAQSEPAMTFYTADPDPTDVTLDRHNAEITVGGDTLTLHATAPAGASLTWASDNTDEATVTSGGVVAAVAAGTVTITVSYTDSSDVVHSDSCVIHVKPSEA